MSSSSPTRTSSLLSSSTLSSPRSSSTTGDGSLPTEGGSEVSSTPNLISSTTSSVLQATSSVSRTTLSQFVPFSSTASSSPVSSVSPTAALPFSATGSGGPITLTQTASSDVPPPSGTSKAKGKSFLENKPLSGFIFGLAGLAFLAIVFFAVTSFVHRRNRKRLLPDAFDPGRVEGETPGERDSHADLLGQHTGVHAHSDYPPDNTVVIGFTGVGAGGTPGPVSVRSSPMHSYISQGYIPHDDGYHPQYHNQSNVSVGYNPTPHPYDVYGLGSDRVYPNNINQGQHDPFKFPDTNGDVPSMADSSLPRQFQPQSPSSTSHQYSRSPPPLYYSPQTPSQTSPPPWHYPLPSAPDQKVLPPPVLS